MRYFGITFLVIVERGLSIHQSLGDVQYDVEPIARLAEGDCVLVLSRLEYGVGQALFGQICGGKFEGGWIQMTLPKVDGCRWPLVEQLT